jgi:hypothetical protein
VATVEALRTAALALPEAAEREWYGEPDFHFRGKSFALRSRGRTIMKLEKGHQTLLFEIRPETFGPCKVATVHWSYVELDHLDDAELTALVREAYTQVAPKKYWPRLLIPGRGAALNRP